jgi:cytoskeleton protein RodZ
MGAFGDKFRKARESKELSFDDVSNVIKISPRMLRAIEEENFDQLPGGVFNKGFIRSYAKHLGLDPEEAVTEYLEYVRKQQIEAQKAWQPAPQVEARAPAKATSTRKSTPSRVSTKLQAPVELEEELPDLQLPREEHIRPGRKEFLDRPSPEIPWKIIAVAAVVIVLAGVLWFRHSHRHSQASNPPTPAQPMSTQAPTATATPASGPPDSNPSVTKPVTPPSPSAVPDTDDEKGDVTVRNFGKPLPKATSQSSGSLTLTVRATENSWISVTADGQPLTEETLIAPAHPTYRASQNFVVKVGNAAGVTFLWNGQEIPAQGGEGEVKTLVFDSTGMRAASSSQPASTPNQ